MTDIIKLARESELNKELWLTNECKARLERFAELVAAQEREACHQIAIARYATMKATENAHYRLSDKPFQPETFGFDLATCIESKDIADAIRARAKEQTP